MLIKNSDNQKGGGINCEVIKEKKLNHVGNYMVLGTIESKQSVLVTLRGLNEGDRGDARCV